MTRQQLITYVCWGVKVPCHSISNDNSVALASPPLSSTEALFGVLWLTVKSPHFIFTSATLSLYVIHDPTDFPAKGDKTQKHGMLLATFVPYNKMISHLI